jgi:tetratricopeptide (TPR) repeat protein
MATTSKHARTAPGSHHGQDADTFVGFVEQFYRAWILPYWRHALVLLCLVLLAVVVVQTIAGRKKAREAQAFLALSEAEDIDALKGVAEDYPSQVAGVQAEIDVARKLYEEGKYDQAATRFAMIAKKDVEPAFSRAARLGEAYALEADGEFQSAEKRFAGLAEELEQNSAIVDAYMAAGRCAAAQQKFAEAEKWYKLAVAAAKDEPALERMAEDALEGLNTKRYASAPPPETTEQAEDTDEQADGTAAQAGAADTPPKEKAATDTPPPAAGADKAAAKTE